MRRARATPWLAGLLALAVGLAGCSSQAAPTAAPTATPKPAAAAPAQPSPRPASAPTPAEPVAPALDAQFSNLQQAITVQSAQAYVDGAGFHALAEELEQTRQIKPGYVGKVRNVLAVAGAVPWPAELGAEQQRLVGALQQLEAALVANQPDQALQAAEAVHEAEHDLSQATFAWLGSQRNLAQAAIFTTPGDPNHLLGCIGVQSAQAYVDGAGFHALAEELEQTRQIKPGYVGKVRNVLAVTGAVPWPAELGAEQQRLVGALQQLEAALVANQPDQALQAAEAVHEAEHDLSQATFAWLGSQRHDFGSMMPMLMNHRLMRGMMVAGVQSAQAYVDGAGFHALAEELEQTRQIKPGYVGKVRNVLAVTGAVPWPAELGAEQQRLVGALQQLEAALVANQPDQALQAAEAVHEAEHDLSQATFAWLGSQRGS